MRAQVVALKSRLFVEAARATGVRPISILLRHILPHTLSPMLVMATLGVANAILIGASLSFIGLGTIDDRPDWGFPLSQGRSYLEGRLVVCPDVPGRGHHRAGDIRQSARRQVAHPVRPKAATGPGTFRMSASRTIPHLSGATR